MIRLKANIDKFIRPPVKDFSAEKMDNREEKQIIFTRELIKSHNFRRFHHGANRFIKYYLKKQIILYNKNQP